jgi:hypothetical protein
MKKLIILLTVLFAIASCKGPGSGPLVKESFDKTEKGKFMEGQKSTGAVQTEKINATIEPCDGCVKISDLYSNKQFYSGKVIKIKGKVTKFNPQIMGKNWIHIQDGSEFQRDYDLTITTAVSTSVGETLTFEGTIVLDKDFGYGYSYKVLMEEGKIVQ